VELFVVMQKWKLFIAVVGLICACSDENKSSFSNSELEFLKTFSGKAVFLSDYQAPGRVVFFDDHLRSLEVPAHRDSRLRWVSEQNRLFVIQRLESDSYFSIGFKDASVQKEVSTLRGKNIQDLLPLSATEAWVSAYNATSIARIDLQTGEVLSSVGLNREEVDPDGASEPTYLTRVGNLFAATFLNLNAFVPDRAPSIVVWGADGRTQSRARAPQWRNPVTEFKLYDNQVYLGLAGVIQNGKVKDGGILQLDGTTFDPIRAVITEEALQGDIIDFEIISESLGAAIVSKPKEDKTFSRLLLFDPSKGKVLDSPYVLSSGYDFMQVLWDEKAGEILLADRNRKVPSIRFFDPQLNEKPHRTIRLPAPPIQILNVGS
jgi:hypothetical protein